ncbi:unnamed protein product, partial [Prorocentrum cordatum]
CDATWRRRRSQATRRRSPRRSLRRGQPERHHLRRRCGRWCRRRGRNLTPSSWPPARRPRAPARRSPRRGPRWCPRWRSTSTWGRRPRPGRAPGTQRPAAPRGLACRCSPRRTSSARARSGWARFRRSTGPLASRATFHGRWRRRGRPRGVPGLWTGRSDAFPRAGPARPGGGRGASCLWPPLLRGAPRGAGALGLLLLSPPERTSPLLATSGGPAAAGAPLRGQRARQPLARRGPVGSVAGGAGSAPARRPPPGLAQGPGSL